ncbi:bromodomain-containing protein DDB_G0270170 isoform X4 [Zerene cesonia]|uniref:bromodomain-containing protein DDB_G0270170 isoform X4 n=1 Tax=Zerene cesonia TaxID=33412 RepID=UPI0018E50F9D|nr:bromodomain-containing protein DDB_G0270170 isoform X4 [Zerene cesonia]
MKKSAILKLKSIFGSKRGKRHQEQHNSQKSSRSGSPEPTDGLSPSSGESFRPLQRTPPPSRIGPPPSPPVPTKPVAPVAPEPTGPLPLAPCPVCGRTFVPQSLAKHVKICEKMTIKKRKTFDSSRQRREENSPFLEKSPPNTAKATPKPKVQSVRSAIMKPTADLQKCPHCGRAFGVRAFERHVEWCADKAKILPAAPAQPPAHIADAKQRLNARTQYKAPPVRTRRSSQTREKSSNSRSASVESSRGISPPREYGDYKHPRSRASESASSNDHEESSPHVPVIRNSRASQNKSSGDANIKARQARLARDLSSSRLDDEYDPFASAARQMKELMSSDTNIPKKQQNSKDSNRTLPTLKQTPSTKSSSVLRPDNTKIMKDSLNKTYQKTPTLHRMKSFGSTNNDNSPNTFGGRCSSFRLNRNDKRPNLNTTFTKSSKENISSVDKPYFNRNNSLNRSFSSYNNSAYSTPKLKDKIPKLSTSMHHAFQRNTTKQQPLKLDKIKKDEEKKDFVNLDAILSCDNSSMTDSNYIDPMLINENDNLPINVNTILNNPDIISSLESLLTTENLPAKFESFSTNNNNSTDAKKSANLEYYNKENNNNFHSNNSTTPIINDLSSQYHKLMSSLEHSIASRTSGRDDDSLCEDFDLEEFMTSFDEEVNKQKLENKRTCSSTTRVVKQSELSNDVVDSKIETKHNLNCSNNGLLPVNKSMSLVFSSNNIVGEKLFPSSVKRSTSLLDSIQKKPSSKVGTPNKTRQKTDQLEDDIMQSLKEFDKFYETQKHDKNQSHKDITKMYIDTVKRDSRKKCEQKMNKNDNVTNGNHTPSGKISNDSAYSSLNRVSPSKLSLCNVKESNDLVLLEQIPAGSESSDSHKEDRRSISSEEFLAMERSTELQESLTRSDMHSSYNNVGNPSINDKHTNSRTSTHRSASRRQNTKEALSSSGSETSLHRSRRESAPTSAPRLSRFCHECGSKFPVDTAKFCIECGVKRLLV